MATTPFSTASVSFAGQAVAKDRSYAWMADRLWLGRAGNMIQLPPNIPGYTKVPTKGEVVHSLPGGGSSTTYFAHTKYAWTWTWPMVINRDWQVLNGFHERLFGVGPWCFPDPADVNMLPLGASMCGALNAVNEGWVPTVGTVAYDATVAPFETPSGVLRWSGAGLNSQLGQGALSGSTVIANTLLGAPVVPGLPVVGSAYVAHAGGSSSARAQLLGIDATGATVVTVNGTSTVLTTTPQQLTVTSAAGTGSTAIYWVPVVQSLTASAPDLLVSNPQLEYLSVPSGWAAGAGVARVVMTAFDAPIVDGFGSRNVTLTLAST